MIHPLESTTLRQRTWPASLFGFAVDAVLLYSLLLAGVAPAMAHLASGLIAAAVTWSVLALRDAPPPRIGGFAAAATMILLLRGAVLAGLLPLAVPLALVSVAVALVAALLLRVAAGVTAAAPRNESGGRALSRSDPVVALLVYAVLLHLAYLGVTELIHEEAYYWNYSRHMALSYLDHPPMVAWLIGGFTSLLGHTLPGVRAGAFVTWLVGAGFLYALTRRVYDQTAARGAVLLFAGLPVYFLFGLLMTPDMPLTACWVAALYFFHRALVDEEPSAWLGAGIALGLGLLSKYTILLLGFAVFVFMLSDRRARAWFLRPQPWLTAGIALLLFSPVLVWNYQNDWISFIYQGPQRAAGEAQFDLPELLGRAALLLTPVGLAAVAVAAFSGRQLAPGVGEGEGRRYERGFRLLMLSTLVPFAVFASISLFRGTKLNWTGPLWLGSLPLMARMMVAGWPAGTARWRGWLSPRLWRRTVVATLLVLAFALHFMVLGFPGLSYPENKMGLPARGWPDLAQQVESIVAEARQEYGVPPLVVGLNADRLSSWLAFYRSRAMARDGGENTGAAALDTAGPNLFGLPNGHSYEIWFPSLEPYGDRPLVLVGDKPGELEVNLPGRFMGPVGKLESGEGRQTFWHVYYRVLGPLEPLAGNPDD